MRTSGNGGHRRPRQAPKFVVTVGATGAGIALPLLASAGTAQAATASTWDRVAACETGGNWSSTADGYAGGLGLTQPSWLQYGGTDYAPTPDQADRQQQIAVAQKILDAQGPGYWGDCANEAGLTAGGPGSSAESGGSSSASTSGSGSASTSGSGSASTSGSGSGSASVSVSVSASASTSTSGSGGSTGSGHSGGSPATASPSPSASATAPAAPAQAASPASTGSSGSSGSGGTSPSGSGGANSSAPSGGSGDSSVSSAAPGSAGQSSGRHARPRAATEGELLAAEGEWLALGVIDGGVYPGPEPLGGFGSQAGTYTVRPGDNLVRIATKLSISGGWAALYDANRQTIGPDPRLIHPGQVLALG